MGQSLQQVQINRENLMIQTYFNGRPTGTISTFVIKKDNSYFNFLRRIYISGVGNPLAEYLSVFNIYRIAGGVCIILMNKYIVTFAPWPRLVRDD